MVPYDKGLEDRVIGGIIRHPEEIDTVRCYFEDLSVISQKKTRVLWLNLLRMKRNGVPINLPSVCSQLTDVDMKQDYKCRMCGHSEEVEIPVTVGFFWPES